MDGSQKQNDAMPANLQRISDAFVGARLDAGSLAEYPSEVPRQLELGYQVQETSIARWPDSIAGWKVGMVPQAYRGEMGVDRLAGPIFSRLIHMARPGHRHLMPVFENGFAAIEAEFVFRLGADIPVGASLDRTAIIEAIDSLHVGVEIASSPFAGINDHGPVCVITDFGNNNGLLVGPEIPDWTERGLDTLGAQVVINGAVAGTATAADIAGGPLSALEFLVANLHERNRGLKQGDFISTGAVTGVHSAKVGARGDIRFGNFGDLKVELVAMSR